MKLLTEFFLSGTKHIRHSMDDPCVCPANELAAPPLLDVGCGYEIVR